MPRRDHPISEAPEIRKSIETSKPPGAHLPTTLGLPTHPGPPPPTPPGGTKLI